MLVSAVRFNVRLAVAVDLDGSFELRQKGQWKETRSWQWWRSWLQGCAMIATASIVEAQT